eukprot:3708398-Pyramimonas_sp.AAC.1
MDADGAQRGRAFAARRALVAHQKFGGKKNAGHGCRSTIHPIVVTNQCLFCASAFGARRIAQERAVAACLAR